MIQLINGKGTLIDPTSSIEEELLVASEVYYNELGLAELECKVQIRMEATPPHINGYCTDQISDKIHIGLSGYGFHNPFVTLAHEMIHAHQFATGDLRTCGATGSVFWKGVELPHHVFLHIQRTQTMPPWEEEAYGGMYHLAAMYKGANSYHVEPDPIHKALIEFVLDMKALKF